MHRVDEHSSEGDRPGGTPAGRGCPARMRPFVVPRALALSLLCGLGGIHCTSGPAESTPSPPRAAEPVQARESSAREPGSHEPPLEARPPSTSAAADPARVPASEPSAEAPPPTTSAATDPARVPASEPSDEKPPPAQEMPAIAATEPAPAPSGKLEVLARLVEPKSTPHCGVLHLAAVMRYEIVRVLQGTYDERELYAGHSCPEMSATRCRDLPGKAVKRFKAGDVHLLRLDPRSLGASLVDTFADKRLPRYHVRCANLIPPEAL